MHKTVCGDAPDYLKMVLFLHLEFIQDYSDHLPIFSFIHQDPTQSFFVTRSFFSGTSILNSILEHIKTAPSVKHFKSLYLRWYKQSSENQFCVTTIQCVPFHHVHVHISLYNVVL